MSTQSQIAANQANSKLSTGPVTEAGRAISSQNNFRHGFCGAFRVLDCENQEQFDTLLAGLTAEHKPTTVTETIFVEKMAQHHWLAQRALRLQHTTLSSDLPQRDKDRQFGLFLRYQTTNDRAFHKSLNALLKLRAEKRRAQIGFESQNQKQAAELRRETNEKRKQELHQVNVWLAEAKANYQILLNENLKDFPPANSGTKKRPANAA
jgi:hypothetical protein